MKANNGSLSSAASSAQPQRSTSQIRVDERTALRAYRSIGTVTFDLDGTLFTDTGWVMFEITDGQYEGQGVIGTFNNYNTLTLMRFERTQKPLRMRGQFNDGATGAHTWLLDDVAFTGLLVRDASGLIGFRAGTIVRFT